MQSISLCDFTTPWQGKRHCLCCSNRGERGWEWISENARWHPQGPPNEHSHFLREIVINCLPATVTDLIFSLPRGFTFFFLVYFSTNTYSIRIHFSSHEHDATQGEFLSGVQLVWILSVPSPMRQEKFIGVICFGFVGSSRLWGFDIWFHCFLLTPFNSLASSVSVKAAKEG